MAPDAVNPPLLAATLMAAPAEEAPSDTDDAVSVTLTDPLVDTVSEPALTAPSVMLLLPDVTLKEAPEMLLSLP